MCYYNIRKGKGNKKMIVNDNLMSWFALVIIAIVAIVHLFKAWYNSKPKSYWTSKDNFGCVSSMKTNFDWGNTKKKRF